MRDSVWDTIIMITTSMTTRTCMNITFRTTITITRIVSRSSVQAAADAIRVRNWQR